MKHPSGSALSGVVPCIGLLVAGACSEGLDIDLRDSATGLATSDAARQAVESRPTADERGVISYPTYQVAVADNGDTVADVADRLGVDAEELARHNGLESDTRLREGEIIALPERVAEPSTETGPDGTGTILPGEDVDITTLAGDALDRVEAEAGGNDTAAASAERLTENEPIRHQVVRGETAYSIARLYKVSVRSLADWNGLGPDLAVREGQYLIIPFTASASPTPPEPTATSPGQGSPTPLPPSASTPLPQEDDEPIFEIRNGPTSPPAGESGTDSGTARLTMPVSGGIIRAYERGKNDGIDIAADAGTPVMAATDGTVAVITSDTDLGTILVLRHTDDLLTVYANVSDLKVRQGDTVSRGQTIAVTGSEAEYLHFEVREGVDSADPMTYLN